MRKIEGEFMMDKEASVLAASNIGETLVAARTKAGWSQEQVAAKLHLKQEYIERLEQNDFADMKQNATFIKGYIRSYARLFNIPMQQIDQVFASMQVEESEPLKRNVVNKSAREFSMGDKKVRWLTYVIILVFLILVIIWWRSQITSHTIPMLVSKESKVTTTAHLPQMLTISSSSSGNNPSVPNATTSVTTSTKTETFPMIANRMQEDASANSQSKNDSIKDNKPNPHQSINKLNMDINN
jgi:cytoskeleton protein RodZ